MGVATTSDPDDYIERSFYDAFGRTTYEISFEGAVTTYVYDDADGITPGESGRLVAKHYYGGSSAEADYLADLVDGTLNASDETVTYTYDALGRQLTVTQTLTTYTRVTENVYDAQGRLVTVRADVDGNATFDQQINYEYNPVTGQQERVWTGTNSASPTTDTWYVCDDLGRLDQVEEHWRFGMQVDADATADGCQPAVTDYVYDLSGNLAQTRLAGSVVTDYQYDALNRLDLIRNYVDDGDKVYELAHDTLLSEFDYSVRADGKRAAVVEKVYTGSATKTTEIDWLYDNIGRLVAEVYDGDAGSTDATLSFIDRYEFDLVGNRLGKDRDDAATDAAISAFLANGTFTPDLEVDYHYDDNDRLETEKKNAAGTADDRFTVYGYDGTQQTSKTVHPGLDDSTTPVERTTYTYNLQGRMATAEVSQYDSSGQTLESHTKSNYEYDDSGIRVAQTQQVDVNTDGDFDDAGVDTTTRIDYHVDNRNATGYAQVLEEMQGGAVVKSYTIAHDVFLEAIAANQVRHLLKDGHGSTRQLVDALGNVILNGQTPQVFAYDAYGVPHGFTLAQALTTHLYSGEQTDQLTGLQYLRARYYSPAIGTFNRLDPFAGNFSDPQSLHKYLYTQGDPVNANDPTGLYRRPDPDDRDLQLGTDVHKYLGDIFKSLSLFDNRPRWSNQPVSTIHSRLNPPRTWSYAYGGKPDLVVADESTRIGWHYEIKRGRIIGLIARPMLAKDAGEAERQLRIDGNDLRTYIPNYQWNRGRTYLMGIFPHLGFWSPWMPPRSMLVTYNDYIFYPGVLLYDFVDLTEVGVAAILPRTIGTSAAAGLANQGINALRVNYMYVQAQLARGVSLGVQGKAFDRARGVPI